MTLHPKLMTVVNLKNANQLVEQNLINHFLLKKSTNKIMKTQLQKKLVRK